MPARFWTDIGGLVLRASTSLVVIAFAVAGSVGEAAAQYYPVPAGPDYGPPPGYGYRPYPPPPPPYYASPDVYREAYGVPYDPRYDRQAAYSDRAVRAYPPDYDPADSYPPQPMPDLDGVSALRPPADIGDLPTPVPGRGPALGLPPGAPDVTGSVRPPAAAPAPARPSAYAALPPEDRPEQGPPRQLPPQFQRQLVDYPTRESAGTIVIDTPNTYLYLVLGNGRALRYGIGVGREGFTWTGTERISRMSEWPDWHPPKEMIERQPYLPRFMAGGEGNPLGARALYLGNTLYRIHGTNQPSTIGSFVSSGCIRLTNDDVADLYSRVNLGTRVVVLPGGSPASASAAAMPIAR
jgi:lipoprotein-anchoring transpeptidase ErfK/SrfK